MRPTSGFCAICTDVTTETRRRPLGRGGALVNVCRSCDEEPAREGHGIERSYESTGGLLSPNESTAGVRRALGEDYEKIMAIDEKIVCVPATDDADLARMSTLFTMRDLRRRKLQPTVHNERTRARERLSKKRERY